MNLRIPAAFVLPLAIAAAASAVIIDSGDGTGNTSAPSPDPGWESVGSRGVYLGDGWVLTANHTGAGNVVFAGVLYPWVPGSDVRLSNPDTTLADLLLFELYPPYPPLPELTISSAAPALGTSLVMIGNGRDRGDATTWEGNDGYLWASTASKRWGTNFVESPSVLHPQLFTHAFGSVFDESGTGHSTDEAQAATGDSGGAAFAWNGADYELAGILIAIGTFYGQPAETALYSNLTYAADLSVYRDEIVEVMPEPAGGLCAGAALAAWLANAGTRRVCRGTGRAASSPRRA